MTANVSCQLLGTATSLADVNSAPCMCQVLVTLVAVRQVKKPQVHITGSVPAEVAQAIRASFDVLDAPEGADGVLSLLTTRIDESFLDAVGPQLKVVANYAAGVDNIDLDAVCARNVVIANTPDVLTESTAELAVALALALLRRIVEGDRFVRAREPWSFGTEFMLGRTLVGANFLIVGPGRIGRATGRRAEALSARVSYAGRRDDLRTCLRSADVVSLHVALTPETHHLIDADALGVMKETAVLVNTARGSVVDETSLVEALEQRRIGGAALDVFEYEPDIPERLLALDNVVLTPHIGSATRETRVAMGLLAVSALRAVLLDNRTPPNALGQV